MLPKQGRKSPPTYGGDDGATKKEGRGDVPASAEVGRTATCIKAYLNCRHHPLKGRQIIWAGFVGLDFQQHFTSLCFIYVHLSVLLWYFRVGERRIL